MTLLRWVGYVIAAVFILSVILAAVVAIFLFGILGGVIGFSMFVIWMIASGLREKVEGKSS